MLGWKFHNATNGLKTVSARCNSSTLPTLRQIKSQGQTIQQPLTLQEKVTGRHLVHIRLNFVLF
jgi:hypothetical protein